jgi:hypothetical protein
VTPPLSAGGLGTITVRAVPDKCWKFENWTGLKGPEPNPFTQGVAQSDLGKIYGFGAVFVPDPACNDAGQDAGADASPVTTPDAGSDATTDAGSDAGQLDAGGPDACDGAGAPTLGGPFTGKSGGSTDIFGTNLCMAGTITLTGSDNVAHPVTIQFGDTGSIQIGLPTVPPGTYTITITCDCGVATATMTMS